MNDPHAHASFYDNDDGDIIVIAVTDAAVDDLLAHNRFLWHSNKDFCKTN